jgi:HEAT repeat protein
VRDEALEALRFWATRDNTKSLIKLLTTPSNSDPKREVRIIEILGTLRDPAAAGPLAQGLTFPPERKLVSDALRSIGPPAEGAVIPYLQSMDPGARIEACRILTDIGTPKSLDPLAKAMNIFATDVEFYQQAQFAYKQIEARK